MLCTRLMQLPEQEIRIPKKTGFYRWVDYNGEVTDIPTIVDDNIATTRWIANALFNRFSDWFVEPFKIQVRVKPPKIYAEQKKIFVSPIVFSRDGNTYYFYMRNYNPLSSGITTDGKTFYTSIVSFDGDTLAASFGENENEQTVKLSSSDSSVYARTIPQGMRGNVVSLSVGFAYIDGTGYRYWDFASDLSKTYIMRGSQLYWRWQ